MTIRSLKYTQDWTQSERVTIAIARNGYVQHIYALKAQAKNSMLFSVSRKMDEKSDF